MSVVDTSIVIPAPRREVWELVMDPQRLGDWVTIHRRLDRADPGPPHRGFQMEQHIHLRGVDFRVKWELVECDALKRAVWEGRGPARSRAHTVYLLSDSDGDTKFDYHNEFHAPLGPLGAVASRALMGGLSQREAHRSLERLQALMSAPRTS